jgi:hypothetical protein
MVMVPVDTVQVGWAVALTVGAGGLPGLSINTTSPDGTEVHPALLVTVQLCVPAEMPLSVVEVPVPVMPPGLRVQVPDAGKPDNTTLPVPMVQVGCVTVPMTGAPGVGGCRLIVTCDEALAVQVMSVRVLTDNV